MDNIPSEGCEAENGFYRINSIPIRIFTAQKSAARGLFSKILLLHSHAHIHIIFFRRTFFFFRHKSRSVLAGKCHGRTPSHQPYRVQLRWSLRRVIIATKAAGGPVIRDRNWSEILGCQSRALRLFSRVATTAAKFARVRVKIVKSGVYAR